MLNDPAFSPLDFLRDGGESGALGVQIVGLWEWRIPEDRVVANTPFAQLFGVDPEAAARGAPIAAFMDGIVEEDRERVGAAIAESVRAGSAFASAYRVRSERFGIRSVVARGRCERGADGTPLRFPGVVFDVTDERLAEAQRRASDARLRLVLEVANGYAILATDPEGAITDWSAGAEAIFGWRADEAVGQPVALIFTPEDRAAGADVLELTKAARDGKALDRRWHLHKGGSRVFIDGTVHPLPPDASGRSAGFLKVGRDETDRRRAETRRDALARLSAAIRNLRDPPAIAALGALTVGEALEVSRVGYGPVDPGTGALTFERAWAALDAPPLDPVLALQPFASLLGELRGNRPVRIDDAETDPRTGAAGESRPRPARSIVMVPIVEQERLVAALYVDDLRLRPWSESEIVFIREVADLTHTAVERARGEIALQQSEARLRAMNDELESRVAERTAELMRTEEALRQAQKMEAVGQLTGGIAHDFNNLLAAISASLQVLQKRLREQRYDGAGRYVAMSLESVRRAASLTHRLLAFSRRQPLDPKPTDLNRLVGGMAELIRRSVGPDIELEVIGAGDLRSTIVDASQLENSLLNLCINARDAMAPVGGRLTIQTANECLDEPAAAARHLSPGHFVALRVTDTGTGMAPEIVARIFEPFFTTKPIGQGTGLGLSMVYGFVRQSGGQVRVDSAPGRGTTMCIYLPMHAGAAATPEPEPAVESLPAGAGESVLLIEDEATLRTLIAEVLGEAGYRVIAVDDGVAGLRVLESGDRIDLLISDIGLPGGVNGRQLAVAGRRLRPALKVLLITGYADNVAPAEARLDEGVALMTKPFEVVALAHKVRQMIAS